MGSLTLRSTGNVHWKQLAKKGKCVSQSDPKDIDTIDWLNAEQALLGIHGEALLRYLRDAFFNDLTNTDQSVLELAHRLNWIAPDERGQLTPLGATVANSAREYCNWIDNERALPEGLTQNDVSGKRVLDIGCGFGRALMALSRNGATAVGVDVSSACLCMSEILAKRERLPAPDIRLGDARRLDFDDSTFDLVIAVRSIYYMDVERVFSEIARVLVNGGRFFMVAMPLRTFGRNAFRPRTWLQRTRYAAHAFLTTVNSLSYMGTGHQIDKASDLYLTNRGYIRRLEQVGLIVDHHDSTSHIYDAVRAARR